MRFQKFLIEFLQPITFAAGWAYLIKRFFCTVPITGRYIYPTQSVKGFIASFGFSVPTKHSRDTIC